MKRSEFLKHTALTLASIAVGGKLDKLIEASPLAVSIPPYTPPSTLPGVLTSHFKLIIGKDAFQNGDIIRANSTGDAFYIRRYEDGKLTASKLTTDPEQALEIELIEVENEKTSWVKVCSSYQERSETIEKAYRNHTIG